MDDDRQPGGSGREGAIGVFDSGVGGLSVLRAIRSALPHEDLIYVADSGHAPYGDRPAAFVEQRSLTIAEFLLRQGAKAIVVACNTATSLAVEVMRARFTVPIVAMEPAVKPAVALTRSGVVGVLATSGTLSSSKFSRLVEQHGRGAEVLDQPCPGLVELVEQGDLSGEATRALVRSYVQPLLDDGADTLVLGCTHYTFLRPVIESIAGERVTIVDPAIAVARQVRRRLDEAGLLAERSRPGTESFWTSGDPAAVESVIVGLRKAGLYGTTDEAAAEVPVVAPLPAAYADVPA